VIAEARVAGLSGGCDIEVVQHLEVIGEELNWHHEHVGRALGRE